MTVLLLELADLRANRRLRTQNLFCRPREVSQLGNFKKGIQLIKIHTRVLIGASSLDRVYLLFWKSATLTGSESCTRWTISSKSSCHLVSGIRRLCEMIGMHI